jgi:hypothetical protein
VGSKLEPSQPALPAQAPSNKAGSLDYGWPATQGCVMGLRCCDVIGARSLIPHPLCMCTGPDCWTKGNACRACINL